MTQIELNAFLSCVIKPKYSKRLSHLIGITAFAEHHPSIQSPSQKI